MGLYRTDGKRPDGVTLVPWQSGKSLCWDVTVTCPVAESIAVETLGVFNASARHLLDDLGRRISENTGEARETSFLCQRFSILVQRFNAVFFHNN